MIWYQQGDVTIKPAPIPCEAKTVHTAVLAEGEATGHAHRFVGDAALLRHGERLFLRAAGSDVKILHEEHGPLTLPPGEYEVGRVREYDHFAEETREVQD
jgi:hypothetical protein